MTERQSRPTEQTLMISLNCCNKNTLHDSDAVFIVTFQNMPCFFALFCREFSTVPIYRR